LKDKIHELIIELLQMDKSVVSKEYIVKRLLEIEKEG